MLEVLGLREDTELSPLPDQIDIAFRPVMGLLLVRFIGRPAMPGNAFLIAGSVAEGARTLWLTEVFGQTDQRLSRFGFAGNAVVAGIPVYIPLVMTAAGSGSPPRTEAELLLRSSQPIARANMTIQELDTSNFTPTGLPPENIAHEQPRSRQLRVTLSPDLPEAFRINVAVCASGRPACELNAPQFSFDILWGNR